MKNKIQIPYHEDGSIPHYPVSWARDYLWKDPEPFSATLTLIGFSRGRSAANFDFESETGARFTVFMTDLMAMIQSPAWQSGKISGTFVPTKRGQNYGIKLVEKPKPKKASSEPYNFDEERG